METFREEVRPTDPAEVRRIVASSGFFNAEEIEVAGELVEDRLALGAESEYSFLFAESGGRMVGYTCFGRIPFTDSSYDLNWIAVDESLRGAGLGRRLLAETEARIASLGGTRIYVETSSRSQYEPTRKFYIRTGYAQAALLEDFYRRGDGKVVFVKLIPPIHS